MMDTLRLRRDRMLGGGGGKYIKFKDPAVKAICVANWSSDGIGLTIEDAARVTNIGTVFRGNVEIASFDELQYFTSLTSINGSTYNSSYASFYGCTSLRSVTLPPSVTTINGMAFQGCSSLAKINLDNVTKIDVNAFKQTALTDVFAPELTTLGNEAFNGCTSLRQVSSLGRITTISGSSTRGTFSECSSLTKVVLPETITSIGQRAFYQCVELANINLPSSIQTIGAQCFGDTRINTILNLPNLVGGLEEYSFGDTRITKIISLGAITYFSGGGGNYAGVFVRCIDLESVVLPSTLTSIGQNSFDGCTSLISIICLATTPPTLGYNALRRCSSLAHIYVPAGSVEAYKSADGWSGFAAVIEAIDNN